MNVFIPITDEMLEQGLIPEDLAAYRPGLPLMSQFLPMHTSDQSSLTVSVSPRPTPNAFADPALSSSTYLAGLILG